MVEDETKGVEVGAGVEGLAEDLFWGEVSGGEDAEGRAFEVASFFDAALTKAGDFYAVIGDEDIGGGEAAMDDATAVGVFEGGEDILSDLGGGRGDIAFFVKFGL